MVAGHWGPSHSVNNGGRVWTWLRNPGFNWRFVFVFFSQHSPFELIILSKKPIEVPNYKNQIPFFMMVDAI